MTRVAATEPVLDALLDRDFMAARLGAELGEETTVLSTRPIVSKPGSRALVAYAVERPSGHPSPDQPLVPPNPGGLLGGGHSLSYLLPNAPRGLEFLGGQP